MARTRHLRIRLARLLFAVAAPATLACAFACTRTPPPLVLATTTSVANSGLLDLVLPGYSGRSVRPVLIGSGRALEMLAAGQADVVISHAPARESAVLESTPGLWYRKILFNRFLIVGPPADPARIGGAPDAVTAMKRIADSNERFLSRGDESGTHERERELWRLAGAAPTAGRLIVAGAGMGQTLRIASSTGAYTLTDRGTFEALRDSLQLAVLGAGDPRMLNSYAVLTAEANVEGLAFGRWLAEGEGRARLKEATRRIRGFSVWPDTAPATHPAALPHVGR